ncbi:hypothetical protein SAMN04515672_4254 [Natronorubrum texcoconense]|uniref:Uncharacterized protein n=1 Tax=Natronorubrum texcoconense TaxID=1095776 RepID=A0A1G9FRL7_9EURY|nr:hypothetical protein SAMN04515672_4254 [Natronorubrum texcoconense]
MIRGVDSTGCARRVLGSRERTTSRNGMTQEQPSHIEPFVERVIEP